MATGAGFGAHVTQRQPDSISGKLTAAALPRKTRRLIRQARTVILITDEDNANFDPLSNCQRTNGLIPAIGGPTSTIDERTIYLPPYFKC